MFSSEDGMKHLLILLIAILLAAIAFLSVPIQSHGDLPDISSRVVKGEISEDGYVCCTVMIEGTQQRCVAPENALCDACVSFCDSVR